MFSKKKYDEVEKELTQEKDVDVYDDEMTDNPIEALAMGASSDEFDLDPDFKTEYEEIIELKNRKGIEVKYSFKGDEIKEALKIFQRDTIYKRNYIYTGLLLVVFILYIIGIVKNVEAMSVFLAVMCITIICFIWYLPWQHIKKTAKIADDNELSFTMELFDDCIKMGEEEASFILNFNKEINKVFETPSQFLICVGKERVFLLPKRFLKDGQVSEIKELLTNAMQDKYIFKGNS